MVAYNFQAQFAPLVESGVKTQTIRAHRKTRHARRGERIQLYTGMRTKSCRKLIEPDPICTSCEYINIWCDSEGQLQVQVNFDVLDAARLAEFIEADGFLSQDGYRAFFLENKNDLFEGVLIRWEPAP